MRQFLTESLLYALAGGLAGVGLAVLATVVVQPQISRPLLANDGVDKFVVDGRVLVFALVVSVATAILFGILPALGGTRLSVCEVLKESGPGHSGTASRQRLSGLLVVAEVTLSVVLVAIVGVLVSSILQYWRVDWRFPLDHRLMAVVAPSEKTYDSAAKRQRFFAALLSRAREIPGVESAALASSLPLDMSSPSAKVAAEGAQPRQAPYREISPGYHETLGIALRAGRPFNDADAEGRLPVALVSEALAAKLWPDRDPLGARIQVNKTWRQVVGITADVNQSISRVPRQEVCVPYAQAAPRFMRLVLRTAGDPAALADPVRQAIRELDADLPVPEIRTLQGAADLLRAPYEFMLTLLCSFAGAAVLLAGAGIYGVTSRAVAIRTREIGIRIALGADPRQVLGRVLATGLKLTLAGTALGSLAALFAIKAVVTQIWWMKPVSAIGWIAPVALFMTRLALVSSFVPARRATSIEPAAALRGDGTCTPWVAQFVTSNVVLRPRTGRYTFSHSRCAG